MQRKLPVRIRMNKRRHAIVAIVVLMILVVGGWLGAAESGDGSGYIGYAKRTLSYRGVINKGLAAYSSERIRALKIDEYFLYDLLSRTYPALNNQDKDFLKERYTTFPFKRLLDTNDFVADVSIERNIVYKSLQQQINGNFYSIDNGNKDYILWDDVLVKALYCDLKGYDDTDFFILNSIVRGDGGYSDTHNLIGLLLLKRNGCYDREKIRMRIDLIANKIIDAADADTTFSDLYAERVVVLYWGGYGDRIRKEWIDTIKHAYTDDVAWRQDGKPQFNGHVTGLSLLALEYYRQGKQCQIFCN